MVKLDYKSGKSLYEQIYQGIKDLVINRVLKTDEKLPSVRELSVGLTVNPNTVQRAYRTLEAEGVIYSIKGKGNFVSQIPEPDETHIELLYKNFRETVKELTFWGESPDKIHKVIDELYKERNEKCD